MRWWVEAPSAEKNTKRSTPARWAASTIRQVAIAVELLDRAARLVADRGGQVHDRVHAAHRVAERRRVGQVAERDLHPHALGAQPPRVAHQAAHRAAFGEQAAQQRGADEAGRAGKQQHAS